MARKQTAKDLKAASEIRDRLHKAGFAEDANVIDRLVRSANAGMLLSSDYFKQIQELKAEIARLKGEPK